MPFPANVARLDWQFTNGIGSDCHVVQHVHNLIADYDATSLQQIAEFAADCWNTVGFLPSAPAMKSQANNQTALVSVTATSLAAVAPPQVTVPVNVAGSQPGNALPPETALVVTWYTGIVGKSYRGRSYWPGLDFDQLEANGTLTPAAAAAYQLMFTEYWQEMAVVTDSVLCVFSPTLDGSTDVNSALVRDIPHHQRRRNS